MPASMTGGGCNQVTACHTVCRKAGCLLTSGERGWAAMAYTYMLVNSGEMMAEGLHVLSLPTKQGQSASWSSIAATPLA